MSNTSTSNTHNTTLINNVSELHDLSDKQVSAATLKFAESLMHCKPIKKLVRNKNTLKQSKHVTSHNNNNNVPSSIVSRQVSLVKPVSTTNHKSSTTTNNTADLSISRDVIKSRQSSHSSLKPINTQVSSQIENQHTNKTSLLKHHQPRSQTLRYPLQPTALNTLNNNNLNNNNITLQSQHHAINTKLKLQQKQFQTLPPMRSSGVMNRPNTAVLFAENTGKSTGGSPVSSTSTRTHSVTDITAHSADTSPKLHPSSVTHTDTILSLKQQLIEQCQSFEQQYTTAQNQWNKRIESLQDMVLNYQEKQDSNAKTVTELLAQLHQCKLDYNQLNDQLHTVQSSNTSLNAMNNALTESIKTLQQHTTTTQLTNEQQQLNATKSRWQQKQQKNIHSSCIEEIDNLKFQLYYGYIHESNAESNSADCNDTVSDNNRKSTIPTTAPMFVDLSGASIGNDELLRTHAINRS